jgi:hypothetical protein
VFVVLRIINLGTQAQCLLVDGFFLNIRLIEPDFELTKPSTGQEYNKNNHNRKKKTKTGVTSYRYKHKC